MSLFYSKVHRHLIILSFYLPFESLFIAKYTKVKHICNNNMDIVFITFVYSERPKKILLWVSDEISVIYASFVTILYYKDCL